MQHLTEDQEAAVSGWGITVLHCMGMGDNALQDYEFSYGNVHQNMDDPDNQFIVDIFYANHSIPFYITMRHVELYMGNDGQWHGYGGAFLDMQFDPHEVAKWARDFIDINEEY
jgi:hypothetical protein